jgi:uncharacterized membrane protein YhaH (DUF805 family)
MTTFDFRPSDIAIDKTEAGLSQVDVSVWEFLFGFKGRVGRGEYLRTAVPLAIVAWGYVAILFSPLALLQPATHIPWSAWFWLLPLLPFIWVQAALLAKRSHDLGFSGWQYWLLYILLEVSHRSFSLASRVAKVEQNKALAIGSLVVFAIAVYFLARMAWVAIKLLFFKGQPHPNYYGAQTQQVRWS